MDEPEQNRILDYGWRQFSWLNALCLVLFLTPATGAGGAGAARAKRVLMISAQNRFTPATMLLERSVQGELRETLAGRIEFYAEYLDASRFPGETYYRMFSQYLREKYAQRPADLLILFYSGNFELVEALARHLFPNAPLVAVGTVGEEEVPHARLGANVTGVVARANPRGTMELIMKAQPETRRIVVIGGTSATDRIYVDRAEKAARRWPEKSSSSFGPTKPWLNSDSA